MKARQTVQSANWIVLKGDYTPDLQKKKKNQYEESKYFNFEMCYMLMW